MRIEINAQCDLCPYGCAKHKTVVNRVVDDDPWEAMAIRVMGIYQQPGDPKPDPDGTPIITKIEQRLEDKKLGFTIIDEELCETSGLRVAFVGTITDKKTSDNT